MSSQRTILNSFPKEYTPRPLQEKLIEEIQEKINSGAKVILLSAPTGIGKSLIAASVAGYFGSSFVVTASRDATQSRHLCVRQYRSNLAELHLDSD